MGRRLARVARTGCIAAVVGGAVYLAGHAVIGLVLVHVASAMLHPVIRLLAV